MGLFSGKNAIFYIAPGGSDLVASTAYWSFDGEAVDVALDESKEVAQVPRYGGPDAAVTGYPSFSFKGKLYLALTSGRLTYVTITNAGSGYTSAPTVSFSGGAGSGAAATAVVDVAGTVRYIVMTNFGSGYTSAPTVSFSGGSGTGAAATATINDYTDKIINQLYGADNVNIKVALVGTTSSSKMPYYTGSATFDKKALAIPAKGAISFDISGTGNSSLTRNEY